MGYDAAQSRHRPGTSARSTLHHALRYFRALRDGVDTPKRASNRIGTASDHFLCFFCRRITATWHKSSKITPVRSEFRTVVAMALEPLVFACDTISSCLYAPSIPTPVRALFTSVSSSQPTYNPAYTYPVASKQSATPPAPPHTRYSPSHFLGHVFNCQNAVCRRLPAILACRPGCSDHRRHTRSVLR
jgi:hypothetical protein